MPSIDDLNFKKNKSKKFKKVSYRPWDIQPTPDEEVFNEKEKVPPTLFPSENKLPPTKILDENILKDVKEVENPESIDKIIRDIWGVQKSIFVYMLENIQFRENGYQITNPIVTADLVSCTNSKENTVRSSIYRLHQRKYIDYYDRKTGKGGYACYRIKEDLAEAFLKNELTKRGENLSQ